MTGNTPVMHKCTEITAIRPERFGKVERNTQMEAKLSVISVAECTVSSPSCSTDGEAHRAVQLLASSALEGKWG